MNDLSLLFACLLLLVVLGCNDSDDPVIENEEELITDLVYTLLPAAGGPPVTMTFRDPDGDGGQAPTILVSGPLANNTEYDGSIVLLNSSDPSATENITAEVREEADDHQFFYIPESSLDVTLAYTDSDNDGAPIGITTTLTTGDTSTGNLRILLRHEPNKSATGVSITDPAAAGGETDIEVTFAVTVSN